MHPLKSLSPRQAALVLCLTGICGAAANAADDLQAALARMDLAAAKFKGLSADVFRTSHNAVLNDDDKDKGTIAVRRSRVHDLQAVMDVTWPDPKKVHLTGHQAEMYLPKTNSLQIVDLDKKGSAMVDKFLLLGFGSTSAEIQKAYKVELGGPETVAGQKTVRLVLTPKSPEQLAKVPKVELWISDTLNIAVQQKFSEPGGDYTLVTYTNVKLHTDSQELKWSVPKNAHKDVLNK